MKIAVALSGGIDSAASAMILKESGNEVVGYHLVFHDGDDPSKAEEVAEKLEIPLVVLDLRKEFENTVIDYFVSEYRSGRTPNPCYVCNREIKFGLFLEKAIEEGFEYVATGHYARVRNGLLYRALDRSKDQSYFLSSLRRSQLERVIFPLGEMFKSDVKKMVEFIGIRMERESQDVCFLGGKSVQEFLKERIGEMEGFFVNEKGEVMGRHNGYYNFTIGQRRGLKVSSGKRVYVLKIHPESKTVVLGDKERVMFDGMLVGRLNLLVDLPNEFNAQVKIRSNFKEVDCSVRIESDRARVVFAERVFAVTPGQIAVFYDGDLVLGSGIIEKGIISDVEGMF